MLRGCRLDVDGDNKHGFPTLLNMTNRFWMKQSRQENLVYVAAWGLLFAAPVLSLYVRTVSDANVAFNWNEVFVVWRHFAVYLLLFLVHNFLLASLLVHRHKRMLYCAAVVTLLAVFTVYKCSNKPERRGHGPHMERADLHQPPFGDEPMAFDEQHPPMPDEASPRPDERPDERPLRRIHRVDSPPPIVGERDILSVLVVILMFGANLGIKGYFRSRDDRKRLAELERENLEQQMEYLRYQINPHFFMNTLNNIHALVDIDPEQAKGTIVELSKMMRYVLYEGNKQSVPLARELEFIRHYVALMQLRYTEKVRISLALPQETPDSHIPPLILITFIENAFKHGISYQHESFVDMTVSLKGDTLRFKCCNSKADQSIDEHGGVGLANVRKRLDLLYGSNYTLTIDDAADVYQVELVIPLGNREIMNKS